LKKAPFLLLTLQCAFCFLALVFGLSSLLLFVLVFIFVLFFLNVFPYKGKQPAIDEEKAGKQETKRKKKILKFNPIVK